jgi:hypothetical protein
MVAVLPFSGVDEAGSDGSGSPVGRRARPSPIDHSA